MCSCSQRTHGLPRKDVFCLILRCANSASRCFLALHSLSLLLFIYLPSMHIRVRVYIHIHIYIYIYICIYICSYRLYLYLCLDLYLYLYLCISFSLSLSLPLSLHRFGRGCRPEACMIHMLGLQTAQRRSHLYIYIYVCTHTDLRSQGKFYSHYLGPK